MNNNESNEIVHPDLDQPVQTEDVLQKTSRLAKINLIVTVVGLAVLGYLHFSFKSSIEQDIVKSMDALKQEVMADVKAGGGPEKIQAIVDKSADLEGKVESYSGQIAGLEAQVAELQSEIQKVSQLNARISELQASMKKARAPAPKPAAKSSKKPTKAPAKKRK